MSDQRLPSGRFAAGAPSPNPKGRPKLSMRERLLRLLDMVASETLEVRDKDGRVRKVTKLEAVIMQLAYKAAQGKGAAAAQSLLAKVQRRIGMLAPEPPPPPGGYGVLVVERYQTPDEWEAYWTARRVPEDPLEGLPGIDREALARAMEAKQRMQERGYEDPEDRAE